MQAQTGLHVLAIDDNALNRRLIQHMLEAAGHKVETAAGGAEAIVLGTEKTYDAILTDISMPDVAGTDVARALRAEGANQKTIIIAVTACLEPENLAEYSACGIDRVVPKPVDIRYLYQQLADALSQAV